MDYKFKDGSLSFEKRAKDFLSHLKLDEKVNMLTYMHPGIDRLGANKYFFGLEIARGYVGREGGPVSTVFPQPIGLAATFDSDIMKRIGDAASDEARIHYNHGRSWLTLWGPTVDMERDPRWGRTEEAYGEDPYLAGRMVGEYTKGLAGDGKYLKTVPLIKHFYANNNETDRTSSNSNITPRLKYEYYLKPFETAIKYGAGCGVMTCYNSINGVEGINNKDVRDIVKAKWGALFAVSDGGDFGQNVTAHKTFDTHEQSVAAICTIGADGMLDGNAMVAPAVKAALEQGLITEKQLDDTLYPSILVRFKTGEFDGELNPYNKIDDSKLCCDEFDELNLKSALESVVLLKNDGLLPLSNKIKSVAVIGPLADVNYQCWYCGTSGRPQLTVADGFRNINGLNVTCDTGFDIVAIKNLATGKYLSVDDNGNVSVNSDLAHAQQFFMEDWDFGACTFKNIDSGKYLTENEDIYCTAARAFGWFVKERFNLEKTHRGTLIKTIHNKQLKVDGERLTTDFDSRLKDEKLFEIEVVSSGTERIRKLAEAADAAVFCGGNQPLINGREEEDRPGLRLPVCQSKMLNEAAQVNKNTVFVMVSSYPYAVRDEINKAGATIWCSHIGRHLGTAIADTVFGKNNPAGRCPLTWYESDYELPSIFDYDIAKNKTTYLYYDGKPLFAFGHGLSYSNFVYSDAVIVENGENIEITCKITNVSDIDGDEVAQVYVRRPQSALSTPGKQICEFKRVAIKAKEQKVVKFVVVKKDLLIYNTNINDYSLLDGEYEFFIGTASDDVRLKCKIKIQGESVNEKQCIKTVNPLTADNYQYMEFLTDTDGREYLFGPDGKSFCEFYNLGMHGYNRLFVEYSTPAGECNLTVSDCNTSEIVACEDIPTTRSLKRFNEICIKVKPYSGMRNLKFNFNKTASFKGFRFEREH